MNHRFRFLTVLAAAGCVLAPLTQAARAIEVGSTGYKFLQMNPDASAMALGRTFSTERGGATALAGNPAGLTGVGTVSAVVSHTEWLSTIRHEFAGAAIRRFGGVIAASFRTQSSGDIPLRTADAGGDLIGLPTPAPLGTYGVYDAALTIAYARATTLADVGGSITYAYEKIFTAESSAMCASVGVQRHAGDLILGAAARNLGYSSKMKYERTPLPWDIQAGAAYDRHVRDVPFRVVGDLRYAPDWYATFHLGAQATLGNVLIARAGYENGLTRTLSTAGFSGGFGFLRRGFRVDYAYQPQRTGLGSRHVLAVAIGG